MLNVFNRNYRSTNIIDGEYNARIRYLRDLELEKRKTHFFTRKKNSRKIKKKKNKFPTRVREFQRKMRLNPAWAERDLLRVLKEKNINFQFQRIIKLDSWYAIVDFWFPATKIVLELDGKWHDERVDKDKRRDNEIINTGMVKRVIRIKNKTSRYLIKNHFIDKFISAIS